MFLKTTSNRSNFTITHINLFIIKLFRIWISNSLNNLTYSDIQFRNCRHIVNNFSWCSWFLWLFLFFLFLTFWLLFISCVLFLVFFFLSSTLFILFFFRCTFFIFFITSSCFKSFLFLLPICFRNCLQLSFWWLRSIFIWKTDKKSFRTNKFSQSWQVLNMIKPSKCMWNFNFLEV